MSGRSRNITNPNSIYKFTDKERDDETQYDYFGARFYDSRIGRWRSVDPLADKYAGWSPYNYTLNNPLKYTDPHGDSVFVQDGSNRYEYRDGKMYNADGSEYTGYKRGNGFWDSIAKFFGDDYKGYTGDVFEALQSIENGGQNGSKLISDLVNDRQTTLIQDLSGETNFDAFDAQGGVKNVYWNSSFSGFAGDAFGNNTVYFGGFVALSHELGHSWDLLDGSMDTRFWGSNPWRNSEKISCGIENLIRAENNLPHRYYYNLNKGKIPDFNFPK